MKGGRGTRRVRDPHISGNDTADPCCCGIGERAVRWEGFVVFLPSGDGRGNMGVGGGRGAGIAPHPV